MFWRRPLRREELRSQGFEDGLLGYDPPLDLGDDGARLAYEVGRARGEAAAAKLTGQRPRSPEPIGGLPRL